MESVIFHDLIWAVGAALLGSVLFSLIGLISGTTETATVAPITLLVVLMGAPRLRCSASAWGRSSPST